VKSVNKIRARDLDSDFLLDIYGSKTAGQLQTLLSGYLKKTDRVNRNSLPEDYVNDIDNQIKAVQGDIADIKDEYRKKDVAINLSDLDQNVVDIINGLSYFIQNVRTDRGNTLVAETSTGQRAIKVRDNTGEEHIVILPDTYYERSDEAVSLQLMADRVRQLQLRFTVLEETIKAVIKRLDGLPAPTIDTSLPYYPGGGDSMILPPYDTQGTVTSSLSISSDYETLINEVSDFLYGDGSSSLSFINNKIGRLQTSVTNLEGKVSSGIKRTSLESSVQNDLNRISEFATRIGNLEITKMTEPTLDKSGYFYCNRSSDNSTISLRTPVIRALLCYDNSSVTSAISTMEPYIIDCTQGIVYNYNSTTNTYLSKSLSESTLYDNLFVMDVTTNIIEYIIIDGTLAKLNNGKNSATNIGASSISTRTVTIASNNSERIGRVNNLKKYPPTVLVYDNDITSRTNGSYINNEGVITISHNTDSFVVYNDSDKTIEVLIIMGD